MKCNKDVWTYTIHSNKSKLAPNLTTFCCKWVCEKQTPCFFSHQTTFWFHSNTWPGWTIRCLAGMLHTVVLRRTTVDGSFSLNLIPLHLTVVRTSSEGRCINISPKQRAWAPVLQRYSLKQTRIKLSVGAGPCLIFSKSLRSSDRLLEVMFSNASPSPPSVWPASAAQCWGWGCLSRVGRVGCDMVGQLQASVQGHLS